MQGISSLPTIPFHSINLTGGIEKVQNSLKSKETSSSADMMPELEKACTELESLFIYTLLKEMRSTIPKSGFMSGGRSEEIYTSMMDIHLANEISSKGGIGISSLLIEQLSRNSENEINKKNIDRNDK